MGGGHPTFAFEICKACKAEHTINCCKCHGAIQRGSKWKNFGFDYDNQLKDPFYYEVFCDLVLCEACHISNPDLIKRTSREYVELVLSALRETPIPKSKDALSIVYWKFEDRLSSYTYPIPNAVLIKFGV